MATWIHKNGESMLVEYASLKRHQMMGWSTNKATVQAIESESDAKEKDDHIELSELTRAKLYEIALNRKLDVKTRMSKAELLELLDD